MGEVPDAADLELSRKFAEVDVVELDVVMHLKKQDRPEAGLRQRLALPIEKGSVLHRSSIIAVQPSYFVLPTYVMQPLGR